MNKVHWLCGDCGNMYDETVDHCPNTRLDKSILATRVKDPNHDPLCPQFRLMCTCSDCYPPPCACKIIDAVRNHDRDNLRIGIGTTCGLAS